MVSLNNDHYKLTRGGLLCGLEVINYEVLEMEVCIFDSFYLCTSEVLLYNWWLEKQLCCHLMRERRKIH